jgi:quinol monooxygenase YgiN
VLVVARFAVPETDAEAFRERVAAAVRALAARPGHVSSRLARALDDPTAWTLVSEWESVGAYRRALGNADVRMASGALMGAVQQEPTSYEVLWDDRTGWKPSDRA